MAADYLQLRSAWAQTAQQAARLDAGNRALVLNYLASAAQHTAGVLRTHANDPLAAADAEAYAESMRRQDRLRQGYTVGKQVWTALGFGSVIAIAIGAVLGFIKFVSDVGQAGAQTDLKPAFAAVAASGAATYFILRGIAAAINAGPAVVNGIAEAWDDLWHSADPAKSLVATNLDASEREFFAALGARRPSRAALTAVGPGAAFAYMAMIGIPLALLVYFIFSSLTGATSEPTQPTFPTPTTFP